MVKRPLYRGRVFGIAKARYLSLKRSQARFMLAVAAYNIKRGVAVQDGMMACTG